MLRGGEAAAAATGIVMGTGMENAGNDSEAHISAPALISWTLVVVGSELVVVLEVAEGMTAMPSPEVRELGSGVYSRISPGSSGSGPQGSCSLQHSFPSSLEMKSRPSRC